MDDYGSDQSPTYRTASTALPRGSRGGRYCDRRARSSRMFVRLRTKTTGCSDAWHRLSGIGSGRVGLAVAAGRSCTAGC